MSECINGNGWSGRGGDLFPILMLHTLPAVDSSSLPLSHSRKGDTPSFCNPLQLNSADTFYGPVTEKVIVSSQLTVGLG